MKKIFTFVVLTLIFFNFNNNAFSIEADVFVQSTVNRAAKTLGGGLTKVERIEKLKEIAKDTVKIGAKVLWLQLGIRDESAKDLMKKNDIEYIENKCTKMEYQKFFLGKMQAFPVLSN